MRFCTFDCESNNKSPGTTVRRACYFRLFLRAFSAELLTRLWCATPLVCGLAFSKAIPPCWYRRRRPLKPKPASVGKRFELSNLNGAAEIRGIQFRFRWDPVRSVVSDIKYTVISGTSVHYCFVLKTIKINTFHGDWGKIDCHKDNIWLILMFFRGIFFLFY